MEESNRKWCTDLKKHQNSRSIARRWDEYASVVNVWTMPNQSWMNWCKCAVNKHIRPPRWSQSGPGMDELCNDRITSKRCVDDHHYKWMPCFYTTLKVEKWMFCPRFSFINTRKLNCVILKAFHIHGQKAELRNFDDYCGQVFEFYDSMATFPDSWKWIYKKDCTGVSNENEM